MVSARRSRRGDPGRSSRRRGRRRDRAGGRRPDRFRLRPRPDRHVAALQPRSRLFGRHQAGGDRHRSGARACRPGRRYRRARRQERCGRRRSGDALRRQSLFAAATARRHPDGRIQCAADIHRAHQRRSRAARRDGSGGIHSGRGCAIGRRRAAGGRWSAGDHAASASPRASTCPRGCRPGGLAGDGRRRGGRNGLSGPGQRPQDPRSRHRAADQRSNRFRIPAPVRGQRHDFGMGCRRGPSAALLQHRPQRQTRPADPGADRELRHLRL